MFTDALQHGVPVSGYVNEVKRVTVWHDVLSHNSLEELGVK